jgi:hypothetical protein
MQNGIVVYTGTSTHPNILQLSKCKGGGCRFLLILLFLKLPRINLNLDLLAQQPLP